MTQRLYQKESDSDTSEYFLACTVWETADTGRSEATTGIPDNFSSGTRNLIDMAHDKDDAILTYHHCGELVNGYTYGGQ